jgi:hypothetical protein
MGAPDQLTRAQVDALQRHAGGTPVQAAVLKHPGGSFSREFSIRQNDVLLLLLKRL